MKLQVTSDINEVSIPAWDSFIEGHPHGSVLQSYFLYHIFNQTRYMEPVVVCCYNTSDVIQGIVLAVVIRESVGMKGKFSARTVVYGGPLINEQTKQKTQITELLLEALIAEVSAKSVFIQIRANYDMSDYGQTFRDLNFKWHPRLNLLVDTKNESQVRAGISSGRRRQIKKSLANGARIIQPESEDQVRQFYNILFDLYKHKVKKPLPHWSFFQTFYQAVNHTKQEPKARYFLIEYEKRIVGGILCPYLNGATVFEWYVCGLDREYKDKGVYPSVLATWAAIDYACNNDFQQFDFMGVGIPGRSYGVREFKMKFGGRQVNYGRYTRINNRWFYLIAEMGYNLLSLIKKV